jgi:hypothetical protein
LRSHGLLGSLKRAPGVGVFKGGKIVGEL